MKNIIKTRSTDRDNLLFEFLLRHKFIDSIGGSILFNSSEKVFMERARKLKKDRFVQIGYQRTGDKSLCLVSLDLSIKKMYGLSHLRILPIENYFEGSQLKHAVAVRKICAILTQLDVEYLVHNEFTKDKNLRCELIPDVYVASSQTGYEIQISRKPQDMYNKKLYALQNSKDVIKKLIYLTPFSENIREKINAADEFKKDRFTTVMIFTDTKNKVQVLDLDEYVNNYLI